MIWLFLIPLLLLSALIAACWWGSNVVFHPPQKVPLTVFPEQFALEYERAAFKTEDGLTLSGWAVPAKKATDRTILFCHGWGDNKGDMLDRFHFLHERFNLFFFDNRAHGDSGGTYSTIGYLESFDLDAALLFLKKHRPDWTGRLGICGLSMGATVAIRGMASCEDLRCALLEAPFRSFNTVVDQFCTNKFALPYFPFVWLTLAIITYRLGEDPEAYSPTYHIRELSGRPLLFIAGEKDLLMPLERVRSLYEEAGEPKELWIVPEATHGRCQEIAGGEYSRRVLDFFEKNL